MSELEGTEINEQGQETSSSPSEPEMPHAGQEVSPADPELTFVEGQALPPMTDVGDAPVAFEDASPLEPAEPGIYWCEEEYTGSHPVLQQTIHQGENDLSTMTNPDELLAVAALVRDGVLTGPM